MHPDAGPRPANVFTLAESCLQASVDIEAYLIDLVTHLLTHSIRRLGDPPPRASRRARAHSITV